MRKKTGFRLAVVVAALSLGGCTDSSRAPEAAKTGSAAAGALASYYDSLVQTTLDVWEMETFYSSITGVSLEREQEALLERRIEALRLRATMARSLGGAYDALGALASSKAGGAPDAANKLGASLQAIPGMPKASLDPAGLFAAVAGKLLGVKQARDVLAGSETMAETLDRIRELLERERQVYESIGRERDVEVESIATHLLRNRMASPWPPLDRIAQLIGLPWLDQAKLIPDEKLTQAALALIQMRSRRINLLSESAFGNISRSLESLAAKHREMAGKGEIRFGDVLRTVRRAESDLDEIDKLRTQAKQQNQVTQ